METFEIVEPSYEILYINAAPLEHIERIARVCYKSEGQIGPGTAGPFIERRLMRTGHLAMIEHSMMSVIFVVDRGVTHEMVRHRLASFAQESTRYVDYNARGIRVICPEPIRAEPAAYEIWLEGRRRDQEEYEWYIAHGFKPQIARNCLPTCTKTEIVITANFREWLNIFTLRTAVAAHPQMREVMRPLLKEVQSRVPVIFDGIDTEWKEVA